MPLHLNLQPVTDKRVTSLSFFTWMVTKGRYLLLLLNIILFSVYVYRFYLDRDNSIRISRIEDLVVALSSYESKAGTYDLVQKQADFIVSRNSENVDEVFVLSVIRDNVPANVNITGIEVNGREFIIKAESLDSVAFSNYISLLISKERVKNLLLQSSNYLQRKDSYEVVLVINYL